MAHELKRRDLDRYLYAPPGGESMADVALRVDRFIHLLHRSVVVGWFRGRDWMDEWAEPTCQQHHEP